MNGFLLLLDFMVMEECLTYHLLQKEVDITDLIYLRERKVVVLLRFIIIWMVVFTPKLIIRMVKNIDHPPFPLGKGGGPAHIKYYPPSDGKKDMRIYKMYYYFEGMLHRPLEDGPAFIIYDLDGNIIYEEYHVNGRREYN